jgi:hypothetical protein
LKHIDLGKSIYHNDANVYVTVSGYYTISADVFWEQNTYSGSYVWVDTPSGQFYGANAIFFSTTPPPAGYSVHYGVNYQSTLVNALKMNAGESIRLKAYQVNPSASIRQLTFTANGSDTNYVTSRLTISKVG